MSDIKIGKASRGGKWHGRAVGNRRSGNRHMSRSSKELFDYDSMLSNRIAYLGVMSATFGCSNEGRK